MEGNSESSEGLDELEDIVLGRRFVSGLVGQLVAAYPSAGRGLAEEAVEEAIRKLVKRMGRPPAVLDVRGYLAKTAYNTLNKTAPKIIEREVPLDQRPDVPVPSAEDEALRNAAVRAVKAEIRTWVNRNVREVLLVYVDAIALGEPIEAEEVAELVSPILGQEISAGSVRVWKQRGLKRLREYVESNDWTDRRNSGGEERA